MEEFAKIIVTTKGNQVLFYVEPDGNDYTLHQIFRHELATINVKLGFTKPDVEENIKNAYEALKRTDLAQADAIESRITELLS